MTPTARRALIIGLLFITAFVIGMTIRTPLDRCFESGACDVSDPSGSMTNINSDR